MNSLAPISTRYEASFTDIKGFYRTIPQDTIGTWLQDDWKVTSRSTLNLGVRYDFQNTSAQELNLPPFLPGPIKSDTNNVAPRLGVAYTVNDRTVVRGGYGHLLRAGHAGRGAPDDPVSDRRVAAGSVRRACWTSRPIRSTAQRRHSARCSRTRAISNDNRTGLHRPAVHSRDQQPVLGDAVQPPGVDWRPASDRRRRCRSSRTWSTPAAATRSSIRTSTSATTRSTGVNYNNSDASRRPLTQFGPVQMSLYNGRSNYYGWENAFTRRMINHLQTSVTYTLSRVQGRDARPVALVHRQRPPAAARISGSTLRPTWAASTDWPRPTSGIARCSTASVKRPYGLQVSGVYFYGSGLRFGTIVGGDPRGQNSRRRESLSRGGHATGPAGTIVPRNDWQGEAIHRVDMRLQKHVCAGRARER